MVGVMSPEVSMVTPRCFGQREERLGGFLRDEGQVDQVSGEGPLVGPAEQEQCFREVDRPGVDGVEAVDELAGIGVRIVAGHVEQGLRDGKWGAQLVGGVGRESLLFGEARFEPGEHGVEAVGELAELVVAAFELDAVGERSGRGHAGGVGDARQRGEHAAGEDPASAETERQQERQRPGGLRDEGFRRSERSARPSRGGDDHVGDVAQQEHPHRREQHDAASMRNAGVAEGELEANAQTRARYPRSSSLTPALLVRVSMR